MGIDRILEFLQRLSPLSRSCLLAELERLELCGVDIPGSADIRAKLRAEFRKDGFFITGDLGMIGPDGYLRIVGRGKDLIITGGLNVYPREIEALLDDVPGVEESAVVGLPHEDFGEGVRHDAPNDVGGAAR